MDDKITLLASKLAAAFLNVGDAYVAVGYAFAEFAGAPTPDPAVQRGLDHLATPEANAPAAMPSAPPAYMMPGWPPTGRTVANSAGQRWAHYGEGYFAPLDPDGFVDGPADVTWLALLTEHQILWLVDLTPQEIEDERLYGPLGARWGDPSEPCPYVIPDAVLTPQGLVDGIECCTLGIGHAGPHRDAEGQAVYQRPAVIIDDADWSRRLCTCGQPARHRPGCPRHVGQPFLADGSPNPSEG